MGEPGVDQLTTEHTKEWWEGNGRVEHLVDIALPHEDHEETPDPTFQPGISAVVAAALCVIACLGALASVVIAFTLDVF